MRATTADDSRNDIFSALDIRPTDMNAFVACVFRCRNIENFARNIAMTKLWSHLRASERRKTGKSQERKRKNKFSTNENEKSFSVEWKMCRNGNEINWFVTKKVHVDVGTKSERIEKTERIELMIVWMQFDCPGKAHLNAKYLRKTKRN